MTTHSVPAAVLGEILKYFQMRIKIHLSWQAAATSGITIDHKTLIFETKPLAATAIDLLTKPDELKKIRDEFEKNTKGFTYKSSLPPNLKPSLDQLPKH